MSRSHEALKRISTLSVAIAMIIAMAIPINGTGYTDASLYQNIMGITGLYYWQYEDGTSGGANASGSDYREYYRAPVDGSEQEGTWYFARGETPSKKIRYWYIPIMTTAASSICFNFVFGSANQTTVRLIDVVAVDTIYNGVATPCEYMFGTEDLMDNYQTYLTLNTTSATKTAFYLKDLEVMPKTAKAEYIRIETEQDTDYASYYQQNTFIALYAMEAINEADSETIISEITNINESISSIITEIQNNTSELNTLTQTVIKYGDDANYYLEAITYSTEGQTLAVNTLKQHFTTALQAVQAQNQIIHNNVISNAPTENQVQQAINKEQIAPDVDAAVIGGGTSDSGIGIIMSQTKVVAMMVLVMGIAILSYLLFGRKT